MTKSELIEALAAERSHLADKDVELNERFNAWLAQ